jgi:hypothetical protein
MSALSDTAELGYSFPKWVIHTFQGRHPNYRLPKCWQHVEFIRPLVAAPHRGYR